MEGRAKYGYMSSASIPLKIQSGEIDAYDIIYTTDTHENYVISPDLEPLAVRSRIYVFDSVENANTLLNVNTDTYIGQIVSILVDDKYKGYIVNRDSQGSYYVNKLTEDDISKNGIVYLKGTLSNKLIIFELGEGIYSIEGQYQIVPDGTVYMTGGKELFICSNGSVHHVNGNSIEKYTVADDGTVNIETYLTSADLSQYMTITDAQQIISDLVSQNVENEVIKALGKSIAQQSDIENILNN